MRLARVTAVVFVIAAGALAALACASLVGVGDLSCSIGDAGPGSLDLCATGSGVAILPTTGEIHGLAFVGDATVLGVGFTRDNTTTTFAAELLSASGAVVDPATDKIPSSVANAILTDTTGGVWVVGGAGDRMMIRHYTLAPLAIDKRGDFRTAVSNASVTFREAVAIQPDTTDNVFGTTTTGDLALVRMAPGDPPVDVGDVAYNANIPLRATGGAQRLGSDGGHTLTVLGDTPDASLGLVMVRWTIGLGRDNSFGDGGVVFARFGDGGSARAILADGLAYWVAGQAANASGFVVAHVNEDGTFDTTYGQGGFVVAPGVQRGANAMMITPQGLLVAGFDNGKMALARFSYDAGLDPTFGEGGVMTFGVEGELRALAATQTRVVAGGFAEVDGGSRWAVVWLVK